MEKQMLSYNLYGRLLNNNMPWFILPVDMSQYYTQSEAITPISAGYTVLIKLNEEVTH